MLPSFPPSSGGASVTQALDWADHADAVTVAADWTSASAAGGATGVYKEDRPLGVRMRTDKAVDGVTDTDGARVQGLTHPVAAGDVVIGLRLSIDRTATQMSATPAGAYEAGVVFIDGDSVDDDGFFGFMQYWSSTAFAAHDLYRITDSGGADKFETRSFNLLLSSPGLGAGPYDVFFVRTGTTLTAYAGPAGSVPQEVYSWTVTAGAGLLALRVQHHNAGMPDIMPVVHAYRVMDEVPW